MKRLIVFIMFVILFCCCRDKETVIIDYSYEWDFFIENDTNKEILITEDCPYGPFDGPYILANGDIKQVSGLWQLGGESKAKLEDNLRNDFRISHFSLGDGYPFTMTIDGANVPDEIWLRKYWSFESDFYVRTYTLTVTDELLRQLE